MRREAPEAAIGELARRVVALGTELGLTVSTAESCTGGLVSAAVTEVPGSSAVLRGGVVSYDPEVKRDILGVSQQTIDEPGVGVVSAECAVQMARGAREVLATDVAVSVTGIAGPGGEEPGKPVGTVYLALATKVGCKAERHQFAGDRSGVRMAATKRALELLCEGILESGNAKKIL